MPARFGRCRSECISESADLTGLTLNEYNLSASVLPIPEGESFVSRKGYTVQSFCDSGS